MAERERRAPDQTDTTGQQGGQTTVIRQEETRNGPPYAAGSTATEQRKPVAPRGESLRQRTARRRQETADRRRLLRDNGYDDRDRNRWWLIPAVAVGAILLWEAVEPPVKDLIPVARQIDPDWQQQQGLGNARFVSFSTDRYQIFDGDDDNRRVGILGIEKSKLLEVPSGQVPAVAYALSDGTVQVSPVGDVRNLGTYEEDGIEYSAVGLPLPHQEALNAVFGHIALSSEPGPDTTSGFPDRRTTVAFTALEGTVPYEEKREAGLAIFGAETFGVGDETPMLQNLATKPENR